EARKEILQLSTDTTTHEGLIFMDSTGNKAGSITDLVCYDTYFSEEIWLTKCFTEQYIKYITITKMERWDDTYAKLNSIS
ncbi:MAG: hypothetical protein ACFN41_10970, partial [Hallella multisaccharivorax]